MGGSNHGPRVAPPKYESGSYESYFVGGMALELAGRLPPDGYDVRPIQYRDHPGVQVVRVADRDSRSGVCRSCVVSLEQDRIAVYMAQYDRVCWLPSQNWTECLRLPLEHPKSVDYAVTAVRRHLRLEWGSAAEPWR